MVGELRGVRRPLRRVAERVQHAPVEHDAAMRPDRLLDRKPRELVPERHGAALTAQHARGQTRVQVHDLVWHDLVEQPHLDVRRHDRDRLQHTPRACAEATHPTEHRIAHRRRHVRSPAGQYLRDEERIAGSPLVQLLGINAMRTG